MNLLADTEYFFHTGYFIFLLKENLYEQNLQTCLEQSKKHLGGGF